MCPTGTTLNPTQFSGDATSDFRQAFAVMDVDHDGKISGDDLRSFYATVSSSGDGGEDDMITAMINVADENKDGFVQYDEFRGVLYKADVKNRGEEINCGVMEEVFKVIDNDGDGKLGFDDLRNYLKLIGVNVVGDDEINAMIKLGGGDVCDGVSFDGFLNILALHDF
ncbi:hypothetical protein RND81_05G114300 [Saponaria officinalis]|uniref:EF-hand domain-containing protein n=1 Tax=Saponaria officinalis TaxID=3572 RepID=A0AAW1KWZ5_SAPOF